MWTSCVKHDDESPDREVGSIEDKVCVTDWSPVIGEMDSRGDVGTDMGVIRHLSIDKLLPPAIVGRSRSSGLWPPNGTVSCSFEKSI